MTKKRTLRNGLALRKPTASGPNHHGSTRVIGGDEARFAEVVALIEAARGRAYQAVNAELVSLYWKLGEYISRKIASAEWGDGVVEELAASLARRFPGLRGFTRPNLFRMRQLVGRDPRVLHPRRHQGALVLPRVGTADSLGRRGA
jgi:hypothetical protein